MAKPWEQSAEFKQAKQAVDSVLKQVAEVKAHTARMAPRLASCRKATLERMLKEAKAGREQSLRKNQEQLASSPESAYKEALEKELAVLAKEHEANPKRTL